MMKKDINKSFLNKVNSLKDVPVEVLKFSEQLAALKFEWFDVQDGKDIDTRYISIHLLFKHYYETTITIYYHKVDICLYTLFYDEKLLVASESNAEELLEKLKHLNDDLYVRV